MFIMINLYRLMSSKAELYQLAPIIIGLFCPISHATSYIYMGLIQYYQITCQPVNQAICIFIIVPIVL